MASNAWHPPFYSSTIAIIIVYIKIWGHSEFIVLLIQDINEKIIFHMIIYTKKTRHLFKWTKNKTTLQLIFYMLLY
jgi:nitrogen fixation/metabolism regulation signal transduction histidine kinase